MTELSYLEDCYAKEFDAVIISAEKNEIVLDKTLFYPTSGGQLNDTGTLNGIRVVDVRKSGSQVIHVLEENNFEVGEKIHGIIDWDRRYQLMKMHTASHILSTLIHNETGALITGNQLGLEESRDDFNVEDFDREKLSDYESKVNEVLSKDIPITIKYVSREEAEEMPSVAKLAKGLPLSVDKIRLIDIPGVDLQACGGTHLKNVNEIGQIKITKLKNKGANNKRIYFKLI